MRYFPAFLDLKRRTALVVGGGGPAATKVRLLLKAGANVVVVAPKIEAEMAALSVEEGAVLVGRPFVVTDVAGKAAVIAATGIARVDGHVAAAARDAGVPVNVVDNPKLSTFVVPAIVDRDPITVAVSSAGTAPVLARVLRAKIEAMLPANLGRLARFAETFRSAVKATHADNAARRRFWVRFFSGPIAAALLNGNETKAREQMLAEINRGGEGASQGSVHIVGAGPGDPDLLTLRAAWLLQEADVIVHDRLVGSEILDRARRDAERIYVGKAKGAHAQTQERINELLLRHARAGRRVVRLKGGDPFVFGRGGEEREYLARHGVRAEIVPGITAATGCAAAAGIPLTHRDHVQATTFLTGHGKEGEPDVDWASLARRNQTLVVYMGASTAGRIAARLIGNGMDPATPAAVVANGTRNNQRIETGLLAELPALAKGVGEGPALIFIGEVVRHADAWRERLPRRATAIG